MAQFLADIAGMLEIAAIAAGLLLLHKARTVERAGFLRAAALLLLLGGVSVGLCTGYYWFKYQANGDFETVSSSLGAGDRVP